MGADQKPCPYSGGGFLSPSVYNVQRHVIYVYMYVYMYICVYVYVYMYICKCIGCHLVM